MSNMSYCRFQNTANDLSDCLDHFDEDLSDDEERAREWLIEMCKRIANWYEDEDDDDNL